MAEARPTLTAKDQYTPTIERGHAGQTLETARAHNTAAQLIITEAHAAQRKSKKDGPPTDPGADLLRKYGMVLEWKPGQDEDGNDLSCMLDGTDKWDDVPKPGNTKFLPKLAYGKDAAGAMAVSFTSRDLPGSTELTIRAIIGKDDGYYCVAFAAGSRVPGVAGGPPVAPEPIWIHETDFMLACGLVAEDTIKTGITDNDSSTMLTRTLACIRDPSLPLPSVDVSKRAAERAHISVDTATSLATHLDTFAQGRTDPKRDETVKAVAQFQAKVDACIQPDAADIVGIIAQVGEPGIRDQIARIDALIPTARTAEEKKAYEDSKKILMDVVNREPHGQFLQLFRDLQAGKLDPELTKKLNAKLATISDPSGFFQMSAADLTNPDSLAYILFEHVKQGENGEEITERMTWLMKFLGEHSGDIGMLLLFSAVQVGADIIKSAVEKA